MHRIGFVFYVVFFFCTFSGKAQTELKDTVGAHYFCELDPVFPGGSDSLKAYLKRTIVYPQSAIDRGVEGRCYVKLVIQANGKVGAVKVMRGVPDCPECDEEVVRAMRLMPDWIPSKIGGKAVSEEVNFPVSFRITKEECR